MRSGCRRSRHHHRFAELDPLGGKTSGRARERASYGELRRHVRHHRLMREQPQPSQGETILALEREDEPAQNGS
jgi:hypothetical protein